MKRQFISIIFISCLIGFTLSFYFFIEGQKAIDEFIFQQPIIVRHNKKIEYLDDYRTFRPELFSSDNWLEVNIQDMKLITYQNSNPIEIFSIIKKGDPRDWGGTASGLYNVIFKNKKWLSNTANVYMPNAISFYGKYYLHGEPYYKSGAKLYSENSGGCLRLSDYDSETVYNFIERGTPILVIDKINDNFEYASKTRDPFPEVSAQSYLVADLDSGLIMAKKNEMKKLPMTSLAKLMTAVIISENVDTSSSIMVRESMLDDYGSTLGLDPGKRFGIIELMYPMLIESSNDAAQVLAAYFGRPRTLEMMNEKAKAIFMPNTVFADASGFDPNNISTAKDLFYLTRYIVNNRPLIFDITKGKKVSWSGSGSSWVLNNKNIFFENPDFIGGKTGHISSSGYHGLFVFQLSDSNGLTRRIAIILLGSENLNYGDKSMTSEAYKAYQWVKENYFK